MNSEYSKATISKIKRNKRLLEKKLKVRLNIKGNNVDLQGDEIDIFVAEKVLQAVERTFPLNTALLLIEQDYVLESLNIKDITKKKPDIVKARIIGTKGKTLKLLSELSECNIVLHDNIVSILGPAEKIKEAITALTNLIRGSKQSNVYKYLQKQKKKPLPSDLGLRE